MIHSAAGLRALSEDQVERFARQIIVPDIGAEGQMRLCAARVFVDGHPEGRRIATLYLRAAGITVYGPPTPPPHLDCVVLAGANDLSQERVRTLTEASPLVAWYVLVGRAVRGGLAGTPSPIREASRSREEPAVLCGKVPHHIAGADVATTVVAAILGWIHPGESYELELD